MNPASFINTFWLVESIKVYQEGRDHHHHHHHHHSAEPSSSSSSSEGLTLQTQPGGDH
jgi:hypothetical protein